MMDWANEEYVRLYTRETADDLELSWEALALWRAMLCKFDRSGVIPVKNGWPSIARMVRMPVELVEKVGPELVADGRVRVTRHGFVSPNFTEAQTASKSDKLRQRESRDRRRDSALTKHEDEPQVADDPSRAVTQSHAPVTNRDTTSRDVTLPLLPLLPLPPDSVTSPPVTSRKSPPSRGTPKLKSLPSSEALSAAERLMRRVIANHPTSTLARLSESERRERALKWAEAFRLLHERDRHSWEAINAMVDWTQGDDFWKSNILSGDKLREKWDVLTAQQQRARRQAGGSDGRYGRIEPPEALSDEVDPFPEAKNPGRGDADAEAGPV